MLLKNLIGRYGSEVEAILASIGVPLPEAAVFFVDSGATNAQDAVDGEHGNTWSRPFATIDYAVGQCTANRGDIILVAPGHYEDISSGESIDFDIAGITVVGLGNGTDRPRIDYNHADAAVDIGANNVRLIGLTFRPSVAAVKIGIDIEASVTGTIIERCEFTEGEAGDGTDEFIVTIDLKSANTDTIIRNNVFRTYSTCDGCTTGIMLTAASSRVQIIGNYATGNYSTAFIDDGAACTNLLIRDNYIKVKDGEPGIELTATTTGIIADNRIESTGATADTVIVAADCAWFNNTAVTTDGAAAEVVGGGEVDIAFASENLDHLAKTACADTTDPVDMTTEVVDDTVLANLLTDDGDTSNYDRRYYSLEAIGKQLQVGESTGDADIDISEADYTGYVNILTVTAPSSGLVDCRIDLDFNKDTTGWDTIATAADTLDVVAVIQVDGTNYRSTQLASAQITANGNGTLDASESGVSFHLGPMGTNASIQIHVKESAERDDCEIPYRVSYVGQAPTVTPVAAGA